jgi:hypothetical protein
MAGKTQHMIDLSTSLFIDIILFENWLQKSPYHSAYTHTYTHTAFP